MNSRYQFSTRPRRHSPQAASVAEMLCALLTSATGLLARGALGQQVTVRSHDELGTLAASFNRMSADLAHASMLRRQMTADIAHDLRTPLSVIVGYTEALREGKLLPDQGIFDTMYIEAQHLQHLIDDLRTLSLADAGELRLVRQEVAPEALIERVAATYSAPAAAQGVQIVVEAAPDLPTLAVDVERMAQVFGNLLSNALRYTPAGGSVRLRAEAHNDVVQFHVQDTGTGIAADALPHIFERFYRADAARQQDGASGLGLAIVKSIVEAHGGSVSVVSAPGQGTTFTLSLPVQHTTALDQTHENWMRRTQHMDNDDRQIGRILTRREVLGLLGAAGATLLIGCGATPDTAASSTSAAGEAATTGLNAEAQTSSALVSAPTAQPEQAAEVATAEVANATAVPACVVRPEVTEGPYYVDVDLLRSDIREDREGTPLQLTFNVSQVSDSSCSAYQGVTVEIWHCDALGQYSGVSDRSFNTAGQTWLRGAQVTDSNGQATFTTIYPGWYSGRAVHIHFKVHPDENSVFTSQLFFDDALSQQVFTQQPYAAKGSTPDTLNSTDNIYQDLLLLTTTKTSDGYAATFDIGIDPSTVGTGQSGGPGGPPPNRP